MEGIRVKGKGIRGKGSRFKEKSKRKNLNKI